MCAVRGMGGVWDYMRLHPEVTEFSTIAKRTGLARNTVKKHYGMLAAMLGEGKEKNQKPQLLI